MAFSWFLLFSYHMHARSSEHQRHQCLFILDRFSYINIVMLQYGREKKLFWLGSIKESQVSVMLHWLLFNITSILLYKNSACLKRTFIALLIISLFPFTQSAHFTIHYSSSLFLRILPTDAPPSGDRGSSVVKVLCWFDPSWCQWIFHWYKIHPIALWPWGRLSL